MRIFSPFFCLALIAMTTEGSAQGTSTRWDHNGSVVSLSANGARRQFHYQIPAADLLQIGVQPGTLLFDGRREGDKYSGTAYVFSKVCGALPYITAGPVAPDQRTVMMYGKAPIANSSCRVIGYRDDVLVFSLSPETKAKTDQSPTEQITPPTVQTVPIQQPSDSEYDRYLEQWKVCFDIERPDQTTSARIAQCDAALSYSHLTYDDRARLLMQRAALVDRGRLTAQKPIGVPQNSNNRPTIVSTVGDAPASQNETIWIFVPSKTILFVLTAIIGLLLIGRGAYQMRMQQPVASSSSATVMQNAEAERALETNDSLSSAETPVPPPGSPEGSPDAYLRDEPPSQSMSLKLKRSQRSTLTGKVIFVLDARIGLNAEAHALIKQYRLGSFVVYDSQARERHREATKEHLETTREHPPLSSGMSTQLLGLGKTFYRLGRASVSATMAALALRVTVDSLIRGVHVECDGMDDLLGAERAIKEAATNLKGFLEEAATFDGREEVVEL
ncbi:hypothetical protein [Bradyrhizobium japonicum]|uniref:hypothetical protein n=1 Tax=Bradyrhizobium japonicum TaxID=375 RepID=UPI0004B5B1D0|nr:hypothetical protein [Bradyrhizobium japonicum]